MLLGKCLQKCGTGCEKTRRDHPSYTVWSQSHPTRCEAVAKPGHAGRVTLPNSQNMSNDAQNGRGERPARPRARGFATGSMRLSDVADQPISSAHFYSDASRGAPRPPRARADGVRSRRRRRCSDRGQATDVFKKIKQGPFSSDRRSRYPTVRRSSSCRA